MDSQELSPAADLQTTLETAARIQDTIRHADTKATSLLTLQSTLAVFVGTYGLSHTGFGWVSTAVALCFCCCAAAACVRFVAALTPRTTGLGRDNRFGLTPSSSTLTNRDVGLLSWQAKELSRLLATIAATKHRHVRSGIPWLGASTIGAVTYLILTQLQRLVP